MDESIRLEHLKTFLTVVSTHSFSAAARTLGISQGTVSNHIAALEEYFDSQLLKRNVKGIEITEAGKIVKEIAEKIIKSLENTKAKISSAKHKFSGTIKIAASSVPEEHLLPGLIAEFQKQYPDIKFKIKTEDSISSLLSLQKNEVDFAATGSTLGYSKDFDFLEIGWEELVLIVPCNHKLSNRMSVEIEEILQYPYIDREETSGTRVETERILESAGISAKRLQKSLELASTESVITAVSEGRGISIVSSIAAKKAQAAGLVAVLKLEDINSKRKLYLLKPKRVMLNKFEVFWNFCKKYTYQGISIPICPTAKNERKQ